MTEEILQHTFFIGKAVCTGAMLLIILLTSSGCVSQYASLGGTETHTIYKDMSIAIAALENDTERKR